MKTLKGRPVRLKAVMSEQEMLEQLRNNEQEWLREGFSRDEILFSQEKKVRALRMYWHRYPEAIERVEKAWQSYAGYRLFEKAYKGSKEQGKRQIADKQSTSIAMNTDRKSFSDRQDIDDDLKAKLQQLFA